MRSSWSLLDARRRERDADAGADETSRPCDRNGSLQRGEDALGDVGTLVVVGRGPRAARRTRRRPAAPRCRRRGGTRASRSATATSSSSPAAWPRLSLTVLKSSRSRNSTASWRRGGPRAPRACSTRSRNSAWFGEPGQRVVERLVGELALEPLALGDVAEAPHPADDLAVDALRHRVALEHAPVEELDHVVALGVGLARTARGPWHERRRDRRAARARTRAPASSSRGRGLVGDAPHLDEPAVEAGDPPLGVDDEDAVGGRVERGAEQRERASSSASACLRSVMSCTRPGDRRRASLSYERVTAARPCSHRAVAVGQRDAEVGVPRRARRRASSLAGRPPRRARSSWVHAGEERVRARPCVCGLEPEEAVELVVTRSHVPAWRGRSPNCPRRATSCASDSSPRARAAREERLVQPPDAMPAALMPEDEQAVDAGPLPWVVDGGLMVVDGRGSMTPRDAVLEHDVADGDEERPPVLVQRDDADHHEVVEVHLDDAAGRVARGIAEQVSNPSASDARLGAGGCGERWRLRPNVATMQPSKAA